MNLQPISPPEPLCYVQCSECKQTTDSERGFADLDAPAGTFRCPMCARMNHGARFQHYCENCRPIEQDELGDWYHCTTLKTHPDGSILCRTGNVDSDYWSMDVGILERTPKDGTLFKMRAHELLAKVTGRKAPKFGDYFTQNDR